MSNDRIRIGDHLIDRKKVTKIIGFEKSKFYIENKKKGFPSKINTKMYKNMPRWIDREIYEWLNKELQIDDDNEEVEK